MLILRSWFQKLWDDVMFYLLKEYCDTSFGFNIITPISGIERILMFFNYLPQIF